MALVRQGKIVYDDEMFPYGVRTSVLPLFQERVEQGGQIAEVSFRCEADNPSRVHVTLTRTSGGTRTLTFLLEQLLVERTVTAQQILDDLIGP